MAAAKPPSSVAGGTKAPAALPPGQIARTDIEEVLRAGAPWILRRVLIEEVITDGKFVGWRVLKMPPEWSNVDLKMGDIVTKVNGMPIERPEELHSALSTLAVASDLRIAYDRDGGQRELTYHIDGGPSTNVPDAMREDAAPPERQAPTGPPRKTIVIVGDEPSQGAGE